MYVQIFFYMYTHTGINLRDVLGTFLFYFS